MDNKSDEQFLIVQATIEYNRKYADEKIIDTDEKITNLTEYIAMITSTTTAMMDQTNNSKSLPPQKDTSNPPYPTTVVPANRRDPPLAHYISYIKCLVAIVCH